MARQSIFQLGTSSFTWGELLAYGMPEFTENPLPEGERFEGFNLRTHLYGFRKIAERDGPEVARKVILLTDIFQRTKRHGASEPRDRVFALYWIFEIGGISFPKPD